MNIISFKKLDSTNKYAKENFDNLEDKTVIVADCQTNGYGQFQRAWVDAGGENIYMTFVLKPQSLKQEHVELTLYLAQAVCDLINGKWKMENVCQALPDIEAAQKEIHVSIKPPNDVLINGKKVAGILAESITKGDKLKGIALGIGINLNSHVENLQKIDQPATSVSHELGHAINKQEFIKKLIQNFFVKYNEVIG